MIAHKLFRQMKSGALRSLFINKSVDLPEGEWMEAEFHPTSGYRERRGWHCCPMPEAPHLSEHGRVWRRVEIEDYEVLSKPKSQGGTWLLAGRMRILQ